MNKDVLRKYIIIPALEYLDMYSESAVQLLLGTAAQESNMGHYLYQWGGGPAIGIYQIEPKTHHDVLINYLSYRRPLLKKIEYWQVGRNEEEYLIASLFYQTLIARLLYQRIPKELPRAGDIEGLANYWKQYYNTPRGKGRISDFVINYRKYKVGEI